MKKFYLYMLFLFSANSLLNAQKYTVKVLLRSVHELNERRIERLRTHLIRIGFRSFNSLCLVEFMSSEMSSCLNEDEKNQLEALVTEFDKLNLKFKQILDMGIADWMVYWKIYKLESDLEKLELRCSTTFKPITKRLINKEILNTASYMLVNHPSVQEQLQRIPSINLLS